MRKIFSAFALCAGLLIQPVQAQQIDVEINTSDPTTKLPAEKWIQLVAKIIDAAPILGKDSVYMMNATGEDLMSVTCRGYFLVGTKPYITDNETTNAPVSLPKWKVTLVPTKSFNKYCKDGVDASGTIASYHGTLNSPDKSFANSTFVIFMKASSVH